MDSVIRSVGPNHALELFGVKLLGINADNLKKLVFSIVLFVVMTGLSRLLRALMRNIAAHRRSATGEQNTSVSKRAEFWARQGIHVFTAIILIVGLTSIWFDNHDNLTTAAGLVTAGLAFALQRVITAFAGYFLILRGSIFNVGDRIVMGGVRGDVTALGFMQTTIMEMGQPPPVQNADPAMWVKSRQYTGRIVTVSNARIFDEPVFNYTRDFPYIWEEMTIPVSYHEDRAKAEAILLAAAEQHTIKIAEIAEDAITELERRYAIRRSDIRPRVYLRMTDNWVELTVRFIARDHAVRDLKDAMSRQILAAFDEAGLSVASATFEVVGLPPLQIRRAPATGEEAK